MRRAAALLATLALLALPATALAQEEFTAELDVDQEVPAPTVPDPYEGSGSATATVSDDESQIDVHLEWSDLTGDAVGAHIHYGPPGQAGGIIFPLDHTAGSPIDQTLTEADFTPADGGPQTYAEALAAMRDGNTYINVHTDANQPGEIRGQLTGGDDGEPELPDSSTAPADTSPGPIPLTPAGLLLVVAGAAAFAFGLHRFSARRI
jgi:Cu/Zn superoxide dismutase